MSTAIASTTLYDLNLFYKNNTMPSLKTSSSHFKSLIDRKAIGTPTTSIATNFSRNNLLTRRNSGCTTTTTSTTTAAAATTPIKTPPQQQQQQFAAAFNSNKLNNSSLISFNQARNNGSLNNNVFYGSSAAYNMQQQQQQQPPPQGHRRLDRSFSEPVSTWSLQQQELLNDPLNSSRYKTELCRPYEENGTCKYGDKCQFAHGAVEMRSLARHPKYKTELCRTFHTVGFCPYGPRCHFIHNAEELRRSSCFSPMVGGGGGGGSTTNVSTIGGGGGGSAITPSQQQQTLPRDVIAARPKALSIGSFSMNSVGESPPSSLSESPTSLGSFFDDPFISNGGSGSYQGTPTTTSTTAGNNAFAFGGGVTQDLMPSAISHHHALAQLQKNSYNRVLNQFTLEQQLNQRNNQDTLMVDDVFREQQQQQQQQRGNCGLSGSSVTSISGPETPSSPVGSIVSDLDSLSLSDSPPCASPLDVSRNLRLPIFSQLSMSDD